MRNSKKFLTLMLAVLMVVSTFAFSTSAATFSDVSIRDEALYQATGLLSDLGVTKGTTETTFSPEALVTREQMAAFIYRLMKAGKSIEGGSNMTAFEDLTDPTFFAMISWANSTGVIKGRSETSFDPKGNIVLQDAYTMIVRALGYEKEETLPYPYGYIDLAEELEIDENLPSSLNYSDSLTRGDVAILLYNTFFADMADGETVTRYEIHTINGVDFPVGMPYTMYKTVAEKIFAVEKVTRRIVATSNLYLDDNKLDTVFDADVVKLKGTGDNDRDVVSYFTAEELGLPGDVDDYFLSDVVLYLKDVKRADGTIEKKALYAEPLLTKTTATKATVSRVAPTKNSDYYTPQQSRHPKASGLLTVDTTKIYLYKAPYSYSKPQITTEIANNEGAYYKELNKNNATFIGLAEKVEEDLTQFVSSDFVSNNLYGGADIFGLPLKQELVSERDGSPLLDLNGNNVLGFTADIFTGPLNQIYSDGYYELDLYDSDSDGIIDYIWYKPYTFGQVYHKENREMVDEHDGSDDLDANDRYDPNASNPSYMSKVVGGVPTIYTYGADAEGVAFKDKDFVIAYLNGPANYIKVAAIVPKVTAKVSSYKQQNVLITLDNGTTVNARGTNKLIAGFKAVTDSESPNPTAEFPANVVLDDQNAFSNLFSPSAVDRTNDFYIYGGRLFYTTATSSGTFDVAKSFLIPQSDRTERTGGMENGYMVYNYALEVFSPGALNKNILVPVSYERNDPATPFDNAVGEYDFSAYLGRICTFTISGGVYTLELAVNADNTGAAAEEAMRTNDAEAQFGKTVAPTENIIFKKITGGTYAFRDWATGDVKVSGMLPNDGEYVLLQPYTKIVVKSRDSDNNVIFTEYNQNNAPNLANRIDYLEYILVNNTSSPRSEYLAALYLEIDGMIEQGTETAASDALRIIKVNGEIGSDADGNWRYFYDVYNPFTGQLETNIPGSEKYRRANDMPTSPLAKTGRFYEVIDDVLQENNGVGALGNQQVFTEGGQLLPTTATSVGPNGSFVEIENFANNNIEVKGDRTIYKTDSDTVVVLVSPDSNNNTDFKWGSIALKSVADLETGGNSLRNFASAVKPGTSGTLVTVYSDNIEAFIKTDPSKTTSDSVKVVDFVIILRAKVDETRLNSNDES